MVIISLSSAFNIPFVTAVCAKSHWALRVWLSSLGVCNKSVIIFLSSSLNILFKTEDLAKMHWYFKAFWSSLGLLNKSVIIFLSYTFNLLLQTEEFAKSHWILKVSLLSLDLFNKSIIICLSSSLNISWRTEDLAKMHWYIKAFWSSLGLFNKSIIICLSSSLNISFKTEESAKLHCSFKTSLSLLGFFKNASNASLIILFGALFFKSFNIRFAFFNVVSLSSFGVKNCSNIVFRWAGSDMFLISTYSVFILSITLFSVWLSPLFTGSGDSGISSLFITSAVSFITSWFELVSPSIASEVSEPSPAVSSRRVCWYPTAPKIILAIPWDASGDATSVCWGRGLILLTKSVPFFAAAPAVVVVVFAELTNLPTKSSIKLSL